MALRPCPERGCKALVRSGRCATHRRAFNRVKAQTPGAKVYADPRWKAARAAAISRAGGRCQALVDGGRSRCPVTSGLHGHHDYPGGVERMLADGADPFDESRIVVLCGSHHGQVTAWEQAEARKRGFRR